jgi:Protein of unknown function (DUF1761)
LDCLDINLSVKLTVKQQAGGTGVGFLIVILAAVVAYAFAAVWYTSMSKPWMKAAGIPMDANGKPMGNGSMMPFAIAFVCQLLVAGMMRHIFVQSGLNTIPLGIMGGFGIGAFLITPWVAMNYAFAARPWRLTLLDGVNSVVGCTLMGIVYGWFGL